MGNITQLDHALGMVMDALDELGLSENTWLFFTSDNGPVPAYGGTSGGLRGNKRSEYEGGIRVPGLVRWPGHIEPGSTSDVPVVGTDVFATVLDIVGIPRPQIAPSTGSACPALEGKPIERKIPLFWRTHVSPPDQRVAMRIGDWKIVGDETLTKFQLYEVQKDWKEENDLASKMPEKTEEMKNILLKLWADIEAEGPSDGGRTNARSRPEAGR